MNIPPDDYERMNWLDPSILPTPGIGIWVELNSGETLKAIRHGHIPTRDKDDLGYRTMQSNVIDVKDIKRWAIK